MLGNNNNIIIYYYLLFFLHCLFLLSCTFPIHIMATQNPLTAQVPVAEDAEKRKQAQVRRSYLKDAETGNALEADSSSFYAFLNNALSSSSVEPVIYRHMLIEKAKLSLLETSQKKSGGVLKIRRLDDRENKVYFKAGMSKESSDSILGFLSAKTCIRYNRIYPENPNKLNANTEYTLYTEDVDITSNKDFEDGVNVHYKLRRIQIASVLLKLFMLITVLAVRKPHSSVTAAAATDDRYNSYYGDDYNDDNVPSSFTGASFFMCMYIACYFTSTLNSRYAEHFMRLTESDPDYNNPTWFTIFYSAVVATYVLWANTLQPFRTLFCRTKNASVDMFQKELMFWMDNVVRMLLVVCAILIAGDQDSASSMIYSSVGLLLIDQIDTMMIKPRKYTMAKYIIRNKVDSPVSKGNWFSLWCNWCVFWLLLIILLATW